MKENDIYEVEIESYDVNGYGVCHIDSKIVFVKRAAVGDKLKIVITSNHKKFAFAEIKEILVESKDRIKPLCKYYDLCGGCDLLHINYDSELKIKENKCRSTLYKFKDIKYNPIIKNDNLYGYRNKVMMPFRKDINNDVIYGFYEKDSHDVVSIDKCIISSDITNNIIHIIERYLTLFNVSIYDEIKDKGIFREVMVRHTKTNEYMVVLILTKYIDLSRLVEILTSEFKEIKSIYININPEKTNVILSNEYKLIYGNKTITEDILGLKFNVSPASFMQVNHDQCEKLYSHAIELANIKKTDNVIDAYCGMGSITLNIAKKANFVYGIEVVSDAIANANSNKELNNISNVEFICGKCEDEITKLVNKGKIDVIFFDPPRKGCDPIFLDTVIKMKINKIIYISCNIATCQRDLKILEDAGYKVEEVTPVDLFSHTAHVESIALITRK